MITYILIMPALTLERSNNSGANGSNAVTQSINSSNDGDAGGDLGIALLSVRDDIFTSGEIKYTLSMNADATYTLTVSLLSSDASVISKNMMDSDKLKNYKSMISKVVIDSTGTTGSLNIGESAFEKCTALKEVEFKGCQKRDISISGAAFSGCTRLKKINLEDTGLSKIQTLRRTGSGTNIVSGGAFYNTALKEVNFPNTLKELGNYAFYGCDELVRVRFAKSGYGESDSFSMGNAVFQRCTSMEKINFEALGKLSTVSFTGSVDSGVDKGLFRDCKSLKSIIIPSNFNLSDSEKMQYMFYNCPSLESLVFEENTSISLLEDNVFSRCSSLKNLDLTPLKNVHTLRNHLIDWAGIVTLKIPASVELIYNYALVSADYLVNVEFEKGSKLREIQQTVFHDDHLLKNINLGDLEHLQILGQYIFTRNYGLNDITLPLNLTELDVRALQACTGLKNVYYNTKALTGVGHDVFADVYSGFTLTIGETVDTIPADFFARAKGHMGKLKFIGPNTFKVSAEAQTGLDKPLDTLNGEYYVSAEGDLYHKNADDTYTLVYKENTGATEFAVPANVNGCKVTGIGSYAFDKSGIKSITFDDIKAVENIADYAFAECITLESIEGCTTLETVKAYFTSNNIAVNDNAFENTAFNISVPGDIGAINSGKKLTSGTIVQYEDEIKITQQVASYLTGDTDKITASVSEKGNNSVFRVYFQCGEKCTFDKNIQSYNEVPVKYHSVEGTDISYYEIGPSIAGSTIDIPLDFTYMNGSADNSKLRVWSVRGTREIFDKIGETSILPINAGDDYPENLAAYKDMGLEIGTEYFEVPWRTKAYPFPLGGMINKLPKTLVVTSDSKLALDQFGLWECLERTLDSDLTESDKEIPNAGRLESQRGRGSDYIQYVDFRDKVTLPKDLKWRDGIAEALANGAYRTEVSGNLGKVYVVIDSKEYLLFTAKANVGSIRPTDVGFEFDENGNIVFKVRMENVSTTSREISYASTDIIVGPEMILYEGDTHDNSTIKFSFKSEREATEYYSYAQPYTSTLTKTAQVSMQNEGTVSLSKSLENVADMRGPDNDRFVYFGEDICYKITAENHSAFDYKKLAYISDPLNNNLYLKPESMQALFDAAAKDSYAVRIDIRNATIAKTSAGKTVSAINGRDTAVTSVQNTGTVGSYKQQEYTSDSDVLTNDALISLEKNSDGVIVMTVTYDGTTKKYTIGKNAEYTDIASALEAADFVITYYTAYTVNYLHDKGLPYNSRTEYIINATVKDTFIMLSNDNMFFYGFLGGSFGEYEITVPENWAYAYDVNGKELKSAYCRDFKAKPEICLTKSVLQNGVSVDSTQIEVTDNTVLDYSVAFSHYGYSSYELLPVVDSLTGMQALLVPVADNADEEWAKYAEKYTRDGTVYFILKPVGNDLEYTFKGVNFGGYYADSVKVTVEKDDKGNVISVNSLIKWYIKNTIDKDFGVNLKYKVLVDSTTLGFASESASYSFKNIAYLNDRESHRLWAAIGGSASYIGYDKNIVTEESKVNPNFDKLDEDDFSRIGMNTNKVTYRLDLFNKSSEKSQAISGYDFYDKLPLHTIKDDGYEFEWQKDVNVSVHYASTAGVTITYKGKPISESDGTEWKVVYEAPGHGNIDSVRQQYMEWNGDFRIDLKPSARAYIYVTLTFPGGGIEEEWKKYVTAEYKLGTLYNSLYVCSTPKTVSHELSDTGEAFLQKGVYETGLYTVKEDGNVATYFRSRDRFTYTNTLNSEFYNATVAYYLVLKNSSNTNLYLTPIYDYLPKGFTFYSLRNNCKSASEGGVGNVNSVKTSTSLIDASWERLAVEENKDMSYIGDSELKESSVLVSLESSELVNGRQMLKFNISGGALENQHDETGYYLKPGQSIQFGYECFTGYAADSEDIADNAVAMEIVDTGADIDLDTDTKVKVSTTYNKASFNDGTRELWDNSSAVKYGFTTGAGSDSKWLASKVKVHRGNEVIPGIDKTVKDSGGYEVKNRNINRTDTAEWTLRAYNDGTAPLCDYTIEDTIDAPHHFVDEVTYETYTKDYFVGTKTGNNISKLSYANVKLFSISERTSSNRNDDFVNITTNKNDVYKIPLDGTEVKCSFNLSRENSSPHTVDIYVSIKCDNAAGKETMKLRFPDSLCGIMPNGYAKLTLQTRNTTGVYNSQPAAYNTAIISPADKSYDANMVSKGTNVTDDNGGNYGVKDTAFISTDVTFPTTSVKTITDKEHPQNTASSNSSENYILFKEREKEFRYTLTVDNSKDKVMNKLVLIDNLPYIGDTNTLSADVSRGSEFKVNLSSTPDFEVTITDGKGNVKTLSSSEYTLQYSAKSADFTDDDWQGIGSDWTGWDEKADVSKIRSIRLIIGDSNKDTPILIDKGYTVKLGFDAIIDADSAVNPGMTAWNTFGYQYLIFDDAGKENYLFATPLKVGLRIPTVPSLSKLLTDSSGASIPAKKDETFSFVIYSGDKISFKDYKPETVGSALADRQFIYAQLKVSNGSSVSEVLPLRDLKQYTYSDGAFKKTDIPWMWDYSFDADGNIVPTSYNIVELDTGSHYVFSPTSSITDQNYTFTYNPAGNISLKYVNMRPDWKIDLIKIDNNNNTLEGALFGLYSLNESEALNDADISAYAKQYDVQIDKTITKDDKTYYLCSVVLTPASGRIEWDGLKADGYIIRELKVPEGYYEQEQTDYLINYDPKNQVIHQQVINYSGFELPETGGSGIGGLMSFAGACLMASAVALYLILRRRRETQ